MSGGFECYNLGVFASLLSINEDLGVPLFAVYIRTPNASLDSKLADVGKP